MNTFLKSRRKWIIFLIITGLLVVSTIGWNIYVAQERSKIKRLADSFVVDDAWQVSGADQLSGPDPTCVYSDLPCPGVIRTWSVTRRYTQSSLREFLSKIDGQFASTLKCNDEVSWTSCRAHKKTDGYDMRFSIFENENKGEAAFLEIRKDAK